MKAEDSIYRYRTNFSFVMCLIILTIVLIYVSCLGVDFLTTKLQDRANKISSFCEQFDKDLKQLQSWGYKTASQGYHIRYVSGIPKYCCRGYHIILTNNGYESCFPILYNQVT
jgi:hypothetical protein